MDAIRHPRLPVWALAVAIAATFSCSSPGPRGDDTLPERDEPGGPQTGGTDQPGPGVEGSGGGSTGGTDSAPDEPEPPEQDENVADVVSVQASGASGAYTFSVTVSSPDTGCDQYADWWEVLTPDGTLLYRRVLQHSHVDEQPFTRSGGPVDAAASDQVVVRAHMNPTGYGGVAFSGSVDSGFSQDPSISATFATELAGTAPLPSGCAF
ncbi:MAG: hypothetical protein AAF436_07380 [Myxococcota bacterium]